MDILADPRFVPPPPEPPGPVGTMTWLRASVARFSSGPDHARRRALVEAELARMDPVALREQAKVDEPVAVLAAALGIKDTAAAAAGCRGVPRRLLGRRSGRPAARRSST
jgi:hypothetical protein